MRLGEKVFVESGAWIALFETADPLHDRARAIWEGLTQRGAKLSTSIAVVIETYTFIERRGSRELALRWRSGLAMVRRLEILACVPEDLATAWPLLDRKQFHKLSLVDATSFVLMRKHGIRVAFAFDVHFGLAGFRYSSG